MSEIKTVEQIAAELKRLIEQEVSKQETDATKFKSAYQDLISDLESWADNSKSLAQQWKEDSFSINQIEEEGFRRGVETAINTIKSYINEISNIIWE